MAKNKRNNAKNQHISPENYIKTRARNLPIGKCYISEDWQSKGLVTILVSRIHSNGNFTFGLFLVDLYCLGVKETFFVFNEYAEFNELLKVLKEEEGMIEVEYSLAHNIIYGAIEYAENLGFNPCKDFEVTQYILEQDDEQVEIIDVEFGLRGKPAIFIGKEEHPPNIIATLEKSVGKGNFTIITNGSLDDNDDAEDEDDRNVDKEDEDWEEDEDDFSEENMAAIIGGTKKGSVRNIARLVFAVYENTVSEEKRAEMDEILNDVDTWEIVDEDETDDSVFLNNENETRYELFSKKIKKDPEKTIPEIEELIAKNPDEYYFHCLLIQAYGLLEDDERSYEKVVSTYIKFPQKIYAFTNYIICQSTKNNYTDLKKLIGNEFNIHKFFPHRHKYSFGELLGLAGALLIYFSLGCKEDYKGIAYAMTLNAFIFYGDNKEKARQISLFAIKMMLAEIDKKDGFKDNESAEEQHL